ncbi:MAG TPA: YkgJ family cysteine cluster protein [Candidatus Nitrosocosmicus sp.]|jgi:Fe-S-cluster containining protein|uniref:YkgJ family cysteine cluster protein n=1 Tax=Candidatus Nitrosocosmicus agrestis TaxID=2563600 RepID=UPI001E2B0D78|nr:YkgJ family cysteine cluster protein [Candidatus Nitrosocosmicus sp. SS]MDR4492163.1 YkgJ family cysteine cluster protein [Candidatus Nitrosocosmicus sp.]HET6589722.1 YkgJ family cysteine cluster protein [Candidatus Nitrosocosmicus sp.]
MMTSIENQNEKFNEVYSALDNLSKSWKIDPIIRDIHLGRRHDLQDFTIKINQVTFHIPYLSEISKYMIWDCLWPECHNCCNRQGRLPLTTSDISEISENLGYIHRSEFLRNETYVATWENYSADEEAGIPLITTLSMINLKRKPTETETENGKPLPCRFLDDAGACTLHPSKPGVCYLYPFYSWSENYKNRISIHASFQLTGDCPGYLLTDSVDDMMHGLEKYSKIIYDYTMKMNSTIRQGFARVDFSN